MSNPETSGTELPPPGTFALEPPAPVQPVPVETAAGRIRLDPKEVAALDDQVKRFVQDITSADTHDEKFQDALNRIHTMGNKEIEASAGMSNRMLDRPVKAMEHGLFSKNSDVGGSLIELRRTIEDLDPSKQGDLFSPRKLLGLIPFGNKILDYFDRYRSAQTHINAIIESLKRGKDELIRDNAAIEQEKINLWTLMERLEKYTHIARELDAELDAKAKEFDAADPGKARIVREEMLFYTRQKVTDLLTQMSVNVQGYLALDLIRRNNLELIKGVDRATTTTIAALRTAVMVAQALTNEKLVLDQITALSTTTGNLIEATSEMLRTQTAEIHQQAASSTIEIDKLRHAFDNIYQTMDAIADFKTKALDSMQATVNVLSQEVEKSRAYLDRARGSESVAAPAAGTGEVTL
ncbi:MAG TPA: toxic anion resistance protein [Candidatus Kapabacteria bacterium]|nr:toxic anion resistance protein [Candidatus Kapabacteria bacterium]